MEDEVSSYLQTEFLFYMLPHYLVIPSFLYRYYKIMQQQPSYDIPQLPGQFLITCFEQQTPARKRIQVLPASYLIKSKLSLFNSYMYLVMILLSLITKKDVFYASEHKIFCPIYLFGVVGWSLSALILRREYQRKMSQSLWTHRIFWIYTATLSITKLFQDYFLPLNIMINIIFIPTNIILGLYAVYRAQDTDTITLLHNEEIPYFIKFLFQNLQVFKVQSSSTLGCALFSEFKMQATLKEMNSTKIRITLDNCSTMFKSIWQKLKGPSNPLLNVPINNISAIKEEIGLLNTLPRRNIFIDRKLRYVKVNEKLRNFYFIISQIGNDRFEVQRQFKEFLKLQEELLNIFNEKNFPKLALPRLKYSEDDEDDFNRAQTGEKWLQDLTKNPIYMVQQVLEFLKINQEKSAPFLTYFNFAYKSFCSKIFLINYLKHQKNRESTVRGPSLIGYYEQEERQTIKIADAIKIKLQFRVQADPHVKSGKDFGFEITCIPQGKQKIRWKLQKNQENIRTLNQKIEEQCKVTVPFYYRILSSITDRESRHEERLAAYRKYVGKLLENEKYYCPSLFQFIRFDPIKLQTRVLGTRISLGDLTKPERRSHYMEEFDDNGEFIEVLRIDRLSQDSYKIHIRRRGFKIQKTTDQLRQFRQSLNKLYKGVCSVPDLDLKDCRKGQVKIRIEKFLRSVQTLPKVRISKYFKIFYENSVNQE